MKRVNSNFCLFLVALTQLTIFLPMGMNVTALNPSTPAIKVFSNNSYKIRYDEAASPETIALIIALAQTMLVVGGAIGSLSFRLWISFFSRRGVLIAMHALSLSSSILMGPGAYFSNSYEILIIGRLLNGIARGVVFSAGPLYIAEITNKETVALFQTPSWPIYFLSSAIGNAVGHAKALGGEHTWPYGLAFPGIFSLIYLLCIPWIPHTLTWTIQKERNHLRQTCELDKRASLSLLRKLRHEKGDKILAEYRTIEKEIDADAQVERASVKDLLSIAKYRRLVWAVILIQMCAQVTGLQAIFQYTNTIFEEAGIRPEDSTYYTLGMLVFLTLVTLLATVAQQRFGSKRMLLLGLSVVFIGLAFLVVSTVTSKLLPAMAYVSVASVATCIAGIGIGPLLLVAAYPSEITTQVTRPNALWIGGACYWLSGAVVVFVTPYSLSAFGGYAYIPFLLFIVLAILAILLFVPDTKGRSSESIQRFFEEGRSICNRCCYDEDETENKMSHEKCSSTLDRYEEQDKKSLPCCHGKA